MSPRKRIIYLRERKYPTEDAEQRALVAWLRLRGIVFAHVPNGGMRSMSEGKRFKALGVSPGVPDILIFDGPPKCPPDWDDCDWPPVGTAIELKRQKGGVVSDSQAAWLRALEKRGWLARVCHGAQEAVDWLTGLGY